MTSPDVLVVGAGPVGLTVASEFVRHGLRPRIVDEGDGPSRWSKAQIVHARTLEVFADMGVAEALCAAGRPITAFVIYASPETKRIARIELDGIDSPYPYMLSIPQRETEILLARHLAQQGVEVERRVRLDRFEQHGDGVASVLVHASGEQERVETAWLVACDGAHSTVRKALDIPFEGSTYEQKIIQADVRVELPLRVEEDEVVVFASPRGVVGFFPLPGEAHFRMIVPSPDERDLEPTLETFERYLAEMGPKGATVSEPAWMVGFRIHCRMVPTYRVDRVFLAGDAAHIHSPAGGQGMNTGIQDAYNLAWKLALVARGVGQPSLLDSYELERKPVAKAVLEGTDAVTQRGLGAIGLRNKVAIAVRNKVIGFVTGLGFVRERAARAVSMLEVGYPDSPIVGQDKPALLYTDVVADRSTEAPGLRDWFDFGGGPAPGARAPDACFEPASEDGLTVHGLLRGPAHALLLFDGAAATAAGYANLAGIAARIGAAYGGAVRAHVIVPAAERPEALPAEASVVLDREGAVHRRYGARSECLYLVRPDGYVAYRSQPANGDKLVAFLDGILKPTAPVAST
ncbi:MAG: FAD-dependent monooxygenase [Myxococcales bacterium]|nr:FAD-dependent monooxygenase [Myxococcales bacterium]